ncbi:hypothetical protein P7C70_g414, partial [Phenoliferia sp. Uapishka_3]
MLFPFAILALAAPTLSNPEPGFLGGLLGGVVGGVVKPLLGAVGQQPVVSALVTSNPGGALINLNALVGVLAPASCAANSVVGIQASIDILGLLEVCVCVELIGKKANSNVKTCPACPANATPNCLSGGGAKCSCSCDDGFFAAKDGTCVPETKCLPPNVLHANPDGTSTCQCSSPKYISDGHNGCALNPSGAARSRRRSRIIADISANVEGTPAYHAARCPGGESACRIGGLGTGYECLDVTTSLESCASCKPGWTFNPTEGDCTPN